MTRKTANKASKQHEVAREPSESASDLSQDIQQIALKAIRNEIRGIASGAIVPDEHDAASRIAWLAQKASSIDAERRKAEAAERKRSDKLTMSDVLAYARQLDVGDRSKLVREVVAIDSRTSVLGS